MALNLTPIFLNKIEKKTTLYLIKDTDNKYKFIKDTDPLLKDYPWIANSDRVKYQIFEDYPWITGNDVNFWYSIKNSATNSQIEITGQKINKKNIFNNFYYTYPLISNEFSDLTTDWKTTYIRNNSNDTKDKNKSQYPSIINKTLLDNYWKIYNLYWNYNDNIYMKDEGESDSSIRKGIYYYDINDNKVKSISDWIRIIFSDNYAIDLIYDKDNNTVKWFSTTTNYTGKMYSPLYYINSKTDDNLKKLDKRSYLNILDKWYLYSPMKYIKTGNELKGYYIQQTVDKKSYNILPWAPLIPITQLKAWDSSANLYYSKWKKTFKYILDNNSKKIFNININKETDFVKFSKEYPTLMFGSNNENNDSSIHQNFVKFNSTYQYSISKKKYNIYSILNEYGYNFLTQWNIKPIYWTLKNWWLTETNPASLSHDIFYVKNYDKDIYVDTWLIWLNNNFVGKTWWFVDEYKLHNNETKGFSWTWYPVKVKWTIYNITFPAVVSGVDIANQCSSVILKWIQNGNDVRECELNLWWFWININQLKSNWEVDNNKDNYTKIKVKIKIMKQNYDGEYSWIMYHIDFGKIKLNSIKDVTLEWTDSNGNATTYTFEAHIFSNKLLPWLKDSTKDNQLTAANLKILIKNSYYSKAFSDNKIKWLTDWTQIIWLYWFPVFIRWSANAGSKKITWINPINELYDSSDKLKTKWKDIPFWVNLNSNILVDNFIKSDVLWNDNQGVYHDLMFYSSTFKKSWKRIDYTYRFDWNQKITEKDFNSVINNNFKFTKNLDWYQYKNIRTFYPYAAWNNAALKTYNDLLKNILTYDSWNGAINYYWLSDAWIIVNKDKYYKVINNFIFSEIINNEIKKYYKANHITYNPLIFFKRIFSYGHLNLSLISGVVKPLDIIRQNINVLQSQRYINIKQMYNKTEKNKPMPVSYGNDLYKYNNLWDFAIMDYQNISSITNISSIINKTIIDGNDPYNSLYYWWLEHDLDDHGSMLTQSSIGYNVLMTNWNVYPFLNTLVNYSKTSSDSEILTSPQILDRTIKVVAKWSDWDNFGGSWLNWKTYDYKPYYNAMSQLSKRSNNLMDFILNWNSDDYDKISVKWLYANKLAIINSYVREWNDIDWKKYYDTNNPTNLNSDLNKTSVDKKELYLYKNLPLQFLYTTGWNTTSVVAQWIEDKLSVPAFWYNYDNNKGIINNKNSDKTNVLEFNSNSDINDFMNSLNWIYNKIDTAQFKIFEQVKKDCKDLSQVDKRQCLLNKIINATDKNNPYFMYKGTTDTEIELRNLIQKYQLNSSQELNVSKEGWSCAFYEYWVSSWKTSFLIPKYIPSKTKWKWKLMFVQEGVVPFNNWKPTLIKCDLNNWKKLLIANDLLLPSGSNNKVYFIPQNSNLSLIINQPLKSMSGNSNKSLANILTRWIINKIFWAAGDEEMFDMSKIVFNKFDNSNINGIYYQIINNIEWNFDAIDNPVNINFKIDDLVAETFYDQNLNKLDWFNPDDGKTYYMSLSSAKKYGIWMTTITPKLYINSKKWIYDYTDLFGKFWEGTINNLSKFFTWNKNNIENTMINKTAGDDTKEILKPAVLKMLTKVRRDIETNNPWIIINNISAVLMDKSDFKDLYNVNLDVWTMFMIVDIDINDLDNWNEHLVIPYLLTEWTIIKDYVDKKYVEYLPYKFDILPNKTWLFNLWVTNLKELVDKSWIDCINHICVWNYSDRFKWNKNAKYDLGLMVSIKSNYTWAFKQNSVKDDKDVASFDFFVKENVPATKLNVPYNLNNSDWYEYDSSKIRYKKLNNKNNQKSAKTFKERELLKLLHVFYKSFNFVFYKIDYKSSNVKINVDKNSDYKMAHVITNNEFNKTNDWVNKNFIDNKVSATDHNIYKTDVEQTIFDKFKDNGYAYKQSVINNWKIKWLVFNLNDKIYDLDVSYNWSDTLKNYITNKVYWNKDKWLEWNIDKQIYNDVKKYFNINNENFDINNYIHFFNTLYVPFGDEKPILCKATAVYKNEDKPTDKAILNKVYTSIEWKNGIITINWINYDGEITHSVESLDNGEHKIKLYIKNVDDNDCDNITLKQLYLSSSNIVDTWTLIINWKSNNIKTNGIIDLSWENITIKKGEFKEIEIDVKDVNANNYSNPNINITIGYKQPTSTTIYRTNELKLSFKGKPVTNNSVCDKIKCSLVKVTPLTDSIDLTKDWQTNVKYQLVCVNNTNKDVQRIDYTIKYTNDYLYPSYIKLDGNNSFSNSIFRLKKWQTIKWYWDSNNYNIIDDKLFIINSIKTENLNFSTWINWNYNVTFEDNTTKKCSISQILYKASLNNSNNNGTNTGWTWPDGNNLRNYNECYITDKSNSYNTVPYNIQWFINNKSSESFIKSWYLYLKFYKLQQNDSSGNIWDYPTYRFKYTPLVHENTSHWWGNNYWWQIGEYDKIVYRAKVVFPSYIHLSEADLVNRIKNQQLKIFNKKENFSHYLNWYYIKIIKKYWTSKTNSNWQSYCDYSSLTTKNTEYYNHSDTYTSWNKYDNKKDDTVKTWNCIYNTTAEIYLYLNSEIYWLGSDHETPEIDSQKVYSIKDTTDYKNKKSWYVVATENKKNDAINIFRNNPYAFFDAILDHQDISAKPFVELWLPITITRPESTGNTNIDNKVSNNQLLTNNPIKCISNLWYQKIWYKWVDTSYKENDVVLRRSLDCPKKWKPTYSEWTWPVWHSVNLEWYWSYNSWIDSAAQNPICNQTTYYKLRSGVNIPYWDNTPYPSYYKTWYDSIPWTAWYQVVLKQVWATFNINDTSVEYDFYPTILAKWWTQYVWVYDINKAESKKYNFMKNPKDKEVYGSVITNNDSLNISNDNIVKNNSMNYILPLNSCYNMVDNKITDLTDTYLPFILFFNNRWEI